MGSFKTVADMNVFEYSGGEAQITPQSKLKIFTVSVPQKTTLKEWSESCSVVSDSLRPRGLYGPWESPGQNTGVGSLSFLQGIFPTQGSNPGLPHCRRILYQLSHQGSPLKEAHLKEWEIYKLIYIYNMCMYIHIYTCAGCINNICQYQKCRKFYWNMGLNRRFSFSFWLYRLES